jgi:REP element-mobilizing transposase RayT
MAYVKNWLHCVWGTKNRIPFIKGELKLDLIRHITENAKKKNIHIDIINGYRQHIHCLISLNADQKLSEVMQLIKGESSYWINKNKKTSTKFEWADEYFGISISESDLPNVRNYIKNQEEHHRAKTWDEDYNEYLKKYGFEEHQG